MVILNKMDLISTNVKDNITKKIQSINSSCKIQYTTHSRVDLDAILGIQAYSNTDLPPRYVLVKLTCCHHFILAVETNVYVMTNRD